MILQSTPRYRSPSNPAERAIQIIEEQFRTLKLDCEAKYGIKIHADHIARAWIIRHAGYLAARSRTESSGATPFYDAFGYSFDGDMVPMPETVIFRKQKPLHRVVRGRTVHKGESSWTEGFWLGRSEENNEHVIGTADMVTRARTVRRLEPEKASRQRITCETYRCSVEHWWREKR